MRTFLLLGFLAGLVVATGCTYQRPTESTQVESGVIDLPPAQLAGDVRRIVGSAPLSLPVEDGPRQGTLATGWQQPFRGDLHVVRYWHERTRYHITVIPDWNDPTHRSRIQVIDETEQRPAESGPNEQATRWSPAPNIHRPERARALLRQIEAELPKAPAQDMRPPGAGSDF